MCFGHLRYFQFGKKYLTEFSNNRNLQPVWNCLHSLYQSLIREQQQRRLASLEKTTTHTILGTQLCLHCVCKTHNSSENNRAPHIYFSNTLLEFPLGHCFFPGFSNLLSTLKDLWRWQEQSLPDSPKWAAPGFLGFAEHRNTPTQTNSSRNPGRTKRWVFSKEKRAFQ